MGKYKGFIMYVIYFHYQSCHLSKFIFDIFASMKNNYPDKWSAKLKQSYKRILFDVSDKIDFASNDYLGFAKNNKLKEIILKNFDTFVFQGSTGSRLMSGNKKWIEKIEFTIAQYHHTENAVIYPSAYQANVGLFSCIADRKDVFLIDEHIHASVYDGIRQGFTHHFKFKHNDFEHLKTLIDRHYQGFETIYVVIEGLYSMEGDIPDVNNLLGVIDNPKVFLIVDEAHSFGVLGQDKLGLFNSKELAKKCVARIIGYGKALGFSGAAIVGSNVLKQYLINFSRSFIYSTALPLYHYQIIYYLYQELIDNSQKEHQQLQDNIQTYLQSTKDDGRFSHNNSPIQYFSLSNLNCYQLQNQINHQSFFAKVIVPPTVPKGLERIRISLHSFNTTEEIHHLVNTLKNLNKE